MWVAMKKNSFFLLVALILVSFADIRMSLGGRGILTIGPFEALSYLLMSSIVVMLYVNHSDQQVFVGIVKNNKILLIYALWSFMSAIFYLGDPGKSICLDFKMLVPSLTFFISFLLLVQRKMELRIVLIFWSTVGLINVGLAMSQYFIGGPYPVNASQDAVEKLNLGGEVAGTLVRGFFSHPNSFSQVIIPYFAVFTVAFCTSEKIFRIKSLVYGILSLLFGFVLVATDSKGAIVWSIMGVLVGYAMFRLEKLRNVTVLILLWLTIVVSINMFAIYYVDELEINALRTLFSRIQFIIASCNLFIDHPSRALLGGGIRYWDEYSSAWSSWSFINAHNVYLNQILMYGIVGLSLLVVFIISIITQSLKIEMNLSGLISPYPYIGAIFAMSGSWFFEPAFSDPIQKFQLFFIAGIIVIITKLSNSQLVR
jgi:O-antigen ligase